MVIGIFSVQNVPSFSSSPSQFFFSQNFIKGSWIIFSILQSGLVIILFVSHIALSVVTGSPFKQIPVSFDNLTPPPCSGRAQDTPGPLFTCPDLVGISHFSTGFTALLVRNGIQKPRSGAQCARRYCPFPWSETELLKKPYEFILKCPIRRRSTF